MEGNLLEAIIFDMDGVVADSEPLHIKAENQTLAPFNVKVTEEDYHKFMGRSPELLLESLVEKYSIDVKMQELLSVHKKNLLQLYKKEVKPIKGALELIQWFSEKKYCLALASSSNDKLVESVISKFKIRNMFNAVVSGSEVKNIKPSPEIFLKASSKVFVSPEKCLVIEDSTAGVKAARSAGMHCIGFRSPHSPGQDLSSADMIIDDLTVLLNKLHHQNLDETVF